jgi:DNA-binding XRE family transcriptional regulator
MLKMIHRSITFAITNIECLYLFIIADVMGERSTTPVPKLLKMIEELRENIKLARLRRKLTATQVCERADISRTTLWQIEKGMTNVTMGAYAQVLFVLGLEYDILKLGADDELGRRLQDANLEPGKRGPRKK